MHLINYHPQSDVQRYFVVVAVEAFNYIIVVVIIDNNNSNQYKN